MCEKSSVATNPSNDSGGSRGTIRRDSNFTVHREGNTITEDCSDAVGGTRKALHSTGDGE